MTSMHVADAPALDARPEQLRRWLEDLPMLNPELSIGALLKALTDFRQCSRPGKRHLPLLHLYRGRVNSLFYAYETPSFQHGIRAQNRELVRRQLGELSEILEQAYANALDSPEPEASEYLAILYCALEQSAHSLRHTFRTYGPIPADIHHRLNDYYRRAEARGLLYTAVQIGVRPERHENISALYKQLMLLTLADPFHLPEGEAMQAFTFLGRYATACRIQREFPTSPQSGIFFLDLAANTPPLPASRMESSKLPTVRAFDINPMVRAATRDIINRDASLKHRILAEHAKWLLKQFEPHLRAQPFKREKRRQSKRQTDLIVGLEAVRNRLASGVSPTVGRPWNITEESNSGYRLSCRDTPEIAVAVGELVALMEIPASSGYQLGLARWQRRNPDGSISLGLEKIPGKVQAATCLLITRTEESVPCLYAQAADEQTCLLVSRRRLKKGLEVELRLSDRKQIFRLGKRGTCSPRIDRYEVPPAA